MKHKKLDILKHIWKIRTNRQKTWETKIKYEKQKIRNKNKKYKMKNGIWKFKIKNWRMKSAIQHNYYDSLFTDMFKPCLENWLLLKRFLNECNASLRHG